MAKYNIKYIKSNTKHIEEEVKILVKDISFILEKIRKIAKYNTTYYIRDVVYGNKTEDKKLRLRIEDNFSFKTINATRKYKMDLQENVKREIEEIVYKGESYEEAIDAIKMQGDFKEENSYEKTRVKFLKEDSTEITLDIYPFGNWLEIEGKIENIHKTCKDLGFSKNDYINDSADDIYLAWIKKHNLPEQWDVRFGLHGEK